MLVPLRRNGQMIGTMAVANREGDVATFDTENLKLFETLANHASVSLENHELIDQLQWEATHDTLTGLGNRREFYRCLARALEERPVGHEARRGPGGPRPVQGDQRHLRPPHRGHLPEVAGPEIQGGPSAGSQGGTARRRRVRQSSSPTRGPPIRRRASSKGSSTLCGRRPSRSVT